MVHWYSSVYCLFELCYISSVKWAYVITRYETLKILWLSLFIMSTTCYTHFIHHAMLFQYHTLHVSYQIHSHIHTYFIHNHIAYFLFWIVISYVYSSSYYAYTLYIHLLHGYLSYTFPISQHIPHTMYTFQYNASDICPSSQHHISFLSFTYIELVCDSFQIYYVWHVYRLP